MNKQMNGRWLTRPKIKMKYTIDRDLKWIRKAVEEKTIVFEWIKSEKQLADVFTKAVTASLVRRSI